MPGIGKIDAPLQGDLPRIINLKRRIEKNGISFNDSNDLKSKTYNFNLNDSTKASLKVGHDSNKMISSLDFAYLNRFKHVHKDGGIDGDTLRSFIRNIYEDSKSVIKNGISFNKIQNSILEFLIKL